MTTPPTGTVTFLFTDIEGSTQRWERDRTAMERALARHNAILDRAVAAHTGYVFKTVGDAYCASFAHASDALAAAIDAQRALHLERWDEIETGFNSLLVRMGIHTGLVELKDGDYFGRPVNRVARLMAAAHGGQILLSLATEQLVRDGLPDGAKLIDLGMHRLKDLEHTEHLYRLVAPGLPDTSTPPDTAAMLPESTHAAIDVEALPAECPYRGLFAFREEDAAFFFGREGFTARLSEAVAVKPMVGVIGPSGSGKSSVVFAGLLPALGPTAERSAGMSAAPTILKLRPGGQPYHALAGVLVPLLETELPETARLVEVERLATALSDGTLTLAKVVARIREKSPGLAGVLFVADQFEELYTLCPDDRTQRGFQDLLFDAVYAEGGAGVGRPSGLSRSLTNGSWLKLALTLRADFMGHALAYRPFADAIQDHNVILGPMNHDELTRAIAKPAELQGRAFEAGLVERIAEDVGEKAGTLPLLEFALTKLWDEQKAGWLTHEAYERIGRVEGAVARHADAVYERLGEVEREGARRVFVQLVQPGEGTEDTRRIATREELGDKAWSLIRSLADARLVVTNRDEAGRETAEVVHEALIRSWGQLKDWMNSDRRFRAWQERLRFALRQWAATGQDEGALMRGAPLAEAEGWLKEREDEIGAAERRFISEGIDVRDRESRERQQQLESEASSARQLRQRAVLLTLALIMAGGLAVAAMALARNASLSAGRAERAAQLSLARELAAAAVTSIERDPERAALLGLEALAATRRGGEPSMAEVETILHRAVNAIQVQRSIKAHAKEVAAKWSPSGELIGTASLDGTAAIWDAATGKLRHRLTTNGTRTYAVAFSPDGSLIAMPSAISNTLQLWDVNSGVLVRSLEGHSAAIIRELFSPDGARIATGGQDRAIIIWDVESGRELKRFDLAIAGPFSFSPDGRLLAIPGAERKEDVLIWDISRSEPHATLHGHAGTVKWATFAHDGAQIATSADDFTVRIWEVASGREVWKFQPHQAGTDIVRYSPDGTLLATGGSDGSILLWDPNTGEQIQRMIGPTTLSNFSFSPDGKRISANYVGTQPVRIWDVATGSEYLNLSGHAGSVGVGSFSPDGGRLVTGSLDGVVKVWDLEPRGEAPVLRHGSAVAWLALSPDGQTLVTADKSVGLRIWKAAAPEPVRIITSSTSSIAKPEIGPDNTRFVSSSPEDVKDVAVWDLESGLPILTLKGHTDDVYCTAYSPDGRLVASGSLDRTAKVWDVQSGRLLHTLEGHSVRVTRIAFSPDSRTLATLSNDRKTRLWNVQTGQQVQVLEGMTGGGNGIAFSPDGLRIATVGGDGIGRVWELSSGKVLATFATEGQLNDVSFSRDGTRLATAGDDNTSRIWDSYTGREIVTLYGHSKPVQSALFSPDGRRLHTASWDGTVRTYVLSLEELEPLVRGRVTRALTNDECRHFLRVDTCPVMDSSP